ncbi:hypothetical protein LWI29_037132 [Acer saccharum]|uniref:Protein kinase domain-containing protein n=1 Tax=Acer saccharum TaxID=4024 RepID=A0AA39SVC2_ACESA|nr:hypothetical protein LWI29_037132 [Acer saccharum]
MGSMDAFRAWSEINITLYDPVTMEQRYERWLTQYDQEYGSREEWQLRFQIYTSNVQFIDSINLQDLPFQLTDNQFTDLTNEEFRSAYMGFRSKGQQQATGCTQCFEFQDLPTTVDWRTKDLYLSASSTKKKNVVVPVLASIVAVSVLVAASSILWILKTRKEGTTWNNENDGTLQLKNRRFLYSEVVRITDNFERIIGRGGFGTVYHGNLDDTQVAVKMLSPSSVQGYKQFQAEVELLMRVHHKNLTTLVGYCDDGTHMGLIYEFMANGNLESHLFNEESSTADVLSWEGRLRIATETAEGLEYLHSGCKPPIIHRDMKPTNILLSEKFHAKIADFGLSRIFPVETGTHISTVIAGTPGYLDPEYYTSNRLTEKSDVYSFGVVLLQMIASKPAIEKSIDRTHIIQWVSFMLAKGDIKNVVDPKLQGDFSMNSVLKAIEVAMACVSQTSAKRPTMKQVVFDLNESLAIEMDRTTVGHEIGSKDSIESF